MLFVCTMNDFVTNSNNSNINTLKHQGKHCACGMCSITKTDS